MPPVERNETGRGKKTIKTFDNLTKSLDDEIMGWKEEQRAKGISEEDISEGLGEATKVIEAERGRSDLERIKKELTSEPTGKTPAELVAQTEKTQPTLPLTKETKAKYLPAVRADGEVIIGKCLEDTAICCST